jgi:hypothetical protein
MKSLYNQVFDEILIDLDFDKETIKLYRDAARHFVKFVSGREGIAKVVQFTALEIKFMYGCDVNGMEKRSCRCCSCGLAFAGGPWPRERISFYCGRSSFDWG